MSSTSKDGLLAVTSTFLALNTIVVGLRFYARKHQKLGWKTDDWFAFLALIAYISLAAVTFVMVHHKILGYPTVDMTPGIGTELSIQLQVATDVTSIVTLASTKLSALFFYHRVFCQRTAKIKRAFEMVLYTTMGLVTLWLIAFALLSGLQCGSHFSALWDGEAVEYCVTIDFLYAYVVSDVILDIWILALPVPQILRLHMSYGQQFSTIGIFLLACVGLGASIARMAIFVQELHGGLAWISSHDQGLEVTRQSYLIVLECGMSLLAINLPSLWMLCVRTIPEKIARSMHSLTSMRSGGSSSPRTTQNHTDRANLTDNSGNASGMAPSPHGLSRHDLEQHKLGDVE